MASKCYKENLIKPHSRTKWFRMPAGKLRKPQNDISQPVIVPGKLADESQLGGLSSLLQLTKEPIIEIKPPLPKPLKKRYRDAVYESIEPIVEHPPPLIVPEPKLEENGENSKSPIETSEEDEERLKVWRSHILEENVNTKKTRARACKGQRYREFMWTNYSNRRRSNRWELNQDKDEISPAKKTKTANKTEKNKSSKISKTVNGTVKSITNKSNDLINERQSDQSEYKSDNTLPLPLTPPIKKQKKRGPKPKGHLTPHGVNTIRTKDRNDNLMGTDGEEGSNDAELEMKNNYSGFVLLTNSNHHTIETNKDVLLQDENRKLENGLVGSRKRKARRQEIRRLAPGSTFKGVDVIAENDLTKDN